MEIIFFLLQFIVTVISILKPEIQTLMEKCNLVSDSGIILYTFMLINGSFRCMYFFGVLGQLKCLIHVQVCCVFMLIIICKFILC